MILDFGNRRKGDFYDLTVGALNLYAGSREGLGGLHATDCPSHPPAIRGDNLHVVFAIKWLQSCERFSYFHNLHPLPRPLLLELGSNIALYLAGSLLNLTDATENHDLAYRNLSVYSLCRTLKNR